VQKGTAGAAKGSPGQWGVPQNVTAKFMVERGVEPKNKIVMFRWQSQNNQDEIVNNFHEKTWK